MAWHNRYDIICSFHKFNVAISCNQPLILRNCHIDCHNSVGDISPPGKCDRMNDMQKKDLELFTSEKRLYTVVCEFTHLHLSETQNRRQNCWCEPGFTVILTFSRSWEKAQHHWLRLYPKTAGAPAELRRTACTDVNTHKWAGPVGRMKVHAQAIFNNCQNNVVEFSSYIRVHSNVYIF
jgi:hypothetical protein